MQGKSSCCTIQATARRQIDTSSAHFVVHEAVKENERISIESCRGQKDRIGDWKHHLKEAVLLKNDGGREK